jgi:transposase
MTLDELEVIETHTRQLDEELAALLRGHQPTVERLAAVPGLGVDSAQQIIAEVLTRNVARRSPSIAPSDVPPR